MTAPSSAPESRDEVLAEFLRDFEASPEPSAVLLDYCSRYPQLADEFRALAEANCMLHQSGQEDSPPVPECVGEFRIVRRVGEGGMGEVYEAMQESLGRRVAVKIIRQGRVSPDKRERFLREQRVLARLHQTHIVPIHTAGVEGPLQYFAMPFIDGAALHHVVRTARLETSASGHKTPTLGKLARLAASNGEGSGSLQPVSASDKQDKATKGTTVDFVPASTGTLEVPRNGNEEPEPLALSVEYFRSVAEVMADAAEAVHHAHGAGILHRDLKPSNLMVDGHGSCWLIDFGLATFLNGAATQQQGASEERLPEPLTVSGVLGTPQYMAPEQCLGKANERTDVWGLGVTLYELLSLRRAFDGPSNAHIREQILTTDPLSPRTWVNNVPADLVAICRKALRKDSGDRYATAADFAADLRRWLHFEPTIARPAHVPRRVSLWARRNKGWAVAMVALFLIVIGLVGTGFANEYVQRKALEQQKKQQQRELQMLDLQRLRLTAREDKWSKQASKKAEEAAEQGNDLNLRNQAAAALIGLDAQSEKRVVDSDASSVAFDSTGNRLLIGGFPANDSRRTKGEGAKVWDLQRDQVVHVSSQLGMGPVAFRADDTPLQLVANPKDRLTLLLWDVAKDKSLGEFRFPGDLPHEALTEENQPTLLLTPDGSFVAALATLPDQKEALAVWEAATGNLVYQSREAVTALALSPDHAFLATGDENGRITIRAFPKGEQVASFRDDRMAITCLAFQRDRRRRDVQHPAGGWLLAAGDTGGAITIWDCESGMPRARCPGTDYHVHAVAFSPNGMFVASAGRGTVKLWDTAAGHLLLEVKATQWVTDVAFSPDGRRMAASGMAAFGSAGLWQVWNLESGRGAQTLRGLTSQVEKVLLSPNERLLAALSHDSRVAVWDLQKEKLLHVFEAPKAAWVDNAALAFSSDSGQLAYSGSSDYTGRAKVWDLATGKEAGSWSFPPA
jgi:serine/threonine protein kinase/WD40 repeat protein